MKKNIRRLLIAILILSAIIIVTYLGAMVYGAFLLMAANHESEVGVVELQTIDDKASKVRDLVFCQMTKERQNKSEYRYYVKKETCLNKKSSKEIEQFRLKICQEIKNDLEKSVYGKDSPKYYAKYVKEGTCQEDLLDENEKEITRKALAEIEKIDKIDAIGRKISMLHVCKIKAGIIPARSREIAIGDESTYEDYVKWGHCPKKTELEKIDDQLDQFCNAIKESFSRLENKKEVEMRYNLYLDGNCKN